MAEDRRHKSQFEISVRSIGSAAGNPTVQSTHDSIQLNQPDSKRFPEI
jgi:hypothetical protein